MSAASLPDRLRVLVVGGGGREHALAWACARSPRVAAVACTPGNGGTAERWPTPSVPPTDAAGLVALARAQATDLVILGPDSAVAAGVADAMAAAGIACFGPTRAAGQVESSKAFAKACMARAGIPTAPFAVFEDAVAARTFIRAHPGRLVVKADGLALGKGVTVCDTAAEAVAAAEHLLLDGALGPAGRRVVVEDRLEGEEISCFAVCDGEDAVMLLPARDYKRAADGDRGPNTGGMGAYAPARPDWAAVNARVRREVVLPLLLELARQGAPYRGCLYVGGLIDPRTGAMAVLEFNARFGDPEAQVVLPLLPDPLPWLVGAATGQVGGLEPVPLPGAAVGVVATRRGYPGPVRAAVPLTGLEALDAEALIFHMGTCRSATGWRAAGGRVLTCVATAPSLAEARQRAYANLARIRFPGQRQRRDIAAGA
ncbi:MAG TPA: phosphoribosylamine--glycine ligase [Candidatus Dormibacteraeota bacterium]|nr:phosphoribosylamine--glycine ligase [Candidatus Dormibacteraeota bacterium]